MPRYNIGGQPCWCKVCRSEDLEISGNGPDWHNLRCSEGHLVTVYGELRETDVDAPVSVNDDKVRIVEHEIVRLYEKRIVLYLPEDEDPEDHIFAFEEDFDVWDIDTVENNRRCTNLSLSSKDLYTDGRLDHNKFDVLHGRVKNSSQKRPEKVPREMLLTDRQTRISS